MPRSVHLVALPQSRLMSCMPLSLCRLFGALGCGYAECGIAVQDIDTDLDLGDLTSEVPSRKALAQQSHAVHLNLVTAPAVEFAPVSPDCPAYASRRSQRLVSAPDGATCRSFATISSRLCIFSAAPLSSDWLNSLDQRRPPLVGQAKRTPLYHGICAIAQAPACSTKAGRPTPRLPRAVRAADGRMPGLVI